MQINPVASTVLVVFYIITSLLLTAIIAFLVIALNRTQALAAEYKERLDPLLEKTDALLTLVTERLDETSEHTVRLLADTEATASDVQARVEQTADVVQQTISRPLIGVNALAAGIGRGLATFAFLQQRETTAKDVIYRNQASPRGVALNGIHTDSGAAITVQTGEE